MKHLKLIITIVLLNLFTLFNSTAKNWKIGYIEDNGLSYLTSIDNFNSIIKRNNLPILATKNNLYSNSGIVLKSSKWLFSLSKHNNQSNKPQIFNYYQTTFNSNGGLLQVGYNILSKSKSDLYVSIGGGTARTNINIVAKTDQSIDNVDLFSFGNNAIKITQANSIYQIGLSYYYPIFRIFQFSQIEAGCKLAYNYYNNNNTMLNNSYIDFGKNNLSDINVGLSIIWSFEINKIK